MNSGERTCVLLRTIATRTNASEDHALEDSEAGDQASVHHASEDHSSKNRESDNGGFLGAWLRGPCIWGVTRNIASRYAYKWASVFHLSDKDIKSTGEL